MYYDSPLIHTVRIGDGRLRGGRSYTYVVAGDTRRFTFTMPADSRADDSSYPFLMGLTADLGQTTASELNVELMRRMLVDELPAAGGRAAGERAAGEQRRLQGGGERGGERGGGRGGDEHDGGDVQRRLEQQFGGDAPQHGGGRQGGGPVVLVAGDLSYADGWGYRWDSYGRMMEALSAQFPVMTTGGNHEVGTAEAWVSYNARYPMPHTASRSPSNLWWSRDMGPVHLISLCSYAATKPGSLQHRWLLRDLASVDRSRTPWLIVMLHVPWYHSSKAHGDESAKMRNDMEDHLYAAGVDLVVAGHIHAYERTSPIYRGLVNPCGPVHLMLGDGGNREGAALPWSEPAPAWSAFREGSFGIGSLRIVNATHASLRWIRTSCEAASAFNRIDLDGATCQSQADGPWIFGEDKPDRPNEESKQQSGSKQRQDDVWIVRSADRSAKRDECTPLEARVSDVAEYAASHEPAAGAGAVTLAADAPEAEHDALRVENAASRSTPESIELRVDRPLTKLALALAFLLGVLAVSAWRSTRYRGAQAEELPPIDEESEYRSL